MGVGGQRHARAALPQDNRHAIHCTGGWVRSRVGLDGCGKNSPLPVFFIRSPNRPARSESLYRLSYRGPLLNISLNIKQKIYSRLIVTLLASVAQIVSSSYPPGQMFQNFAFAHASSLEEMKGYVSFSSLCAVSLSRDVNRRPRFSTAFVGTAR